MIQIIDAKGQACPQPVILAKNALKDMAEGALEVLVDDETAVKNLIKLGNYLKLETTSEKVSDSSYKIIYKVSGQESVEQDTSQITDRKDRRSKGCVVVFSSDHMGEGDEVLGKILIKGFLYALTQLEKLPEAIVFYNGGARLSVKGSEALEDLKDLEKQGVKILTCGTCLSHMGLSDRLAVGSVTNLYEIAELLTSADSVVKP